MNDQDVLPTIIQGGMGVAVSGWELARAVCQTGELGVVSGTALDVVCARRLQAGDPGGHMRRALAAFPIPAMALRVMKQYYVHGGKADDAPFRAVPRFTVTPPVALQELTVVGAFCEVWLAKQEHTGPVGINFLRKIEIPLPFGLLGAMLAGVDYVLIGAGNPSEIPGVVRALSRGEDVEFGVRAQGLRSDDAPVSVRCSPTELLGEVGRGLPVPRFLAIIASLDLAAGLAGDPSTRPFGFIVEGPSAGGHNAPPRGPRQVDELGQPVYDDRDTPDLAGIAALGLPFWLAGAYGTPEGLAQAQGDGSPGDPGRHRVRVQPGVRPRRLAQAPGARRCPGRDAGRPQRLAGLPHRLPVPGDPARGHGQRSRRCRRPQGRVRPRRPAHPLQEGQRRHRLPLPGRAVGHVHPQGWAGSRTPRVGAACATPCSPRRTSPSSAPTARPSRRS